MDDLISRQAALDIVFDFAETPHRMYQQIRELPTIEPKPSRDWNGWENGCGRTYDFEPKRGRWIDEPVYKQTMDGKTWDGYTFCSECREMHEYGYRSNYCPNCGAKMERSENE